MTRPGPWPGLAEQGIIRYGARTQCLVVVFSCWVMSDSLWLHGLQHTRIPCPSPPGVCSNSCPLSWWCPLSHCVLPQIHILTFSFLCEHIWRWGLWEVIRFGWHHEGAPRRWAWCPYTGMEPRALSSACEDRARIWPSVKREVGPHWAQNLPAPCPWPACGTVRQRSLSYLIYGISEIAAWRQAVWSTDSRAQCGQLGLGDELLLNIPHNTKLTLQSPQIQAASQM